MTDLHIVEGRSPSPHEVAPDANAEKSAAYSEHSLSPQASRSYNQAAPRYVDRANPSANEAQKDLGHFAGIHRVRHLSSSKSDCSSTPISIKTCTDAPRVLQPEMATLSRKLELTWNLQRTRPTPKCELPFRIQMIQTCLQYEQC
jgi:hypothetical protein